MNTIKRLRRGGVTMVAVGALALSACTDGFFFDPAAGVTPVTVRYTWVDDGAGAARVEGPQAAGAGEAFDKADGAAVVIRSGETELFNRTVALEASGSDKKISLSVELPGGGAVSSTLTLTLLQGTTELFTGSSSASLTPGQAAEVTVPLAGVVSGVTLDGGPYVLRTLGGTLRLTANGLFATGDVVGPVSATYRALDPTVTVASDGTVTAVRNGTGRIEAVYQGRADTAVVTVEDRCFGPYILLAVGQSTQGTLEANDCADQGNFAYNDWFGVDLGAPTLFRASLTTNGFEPFVGANLPDKATLAVAASQSTEVVSEFAFPAGSYLLRAGSRARTAGPIPTGSYSLALSAASEPQAGCFATPGSAGATWVVDGVSLTAALAGDDCAPTPSIRQDVYGGRLLTGDTAVVTVEAGFDYRFVYGSDVRPAPAGGGRTQWAFTSDNDQSHYVFLRTDAAGPFGQYSIRFDGDIPPDYDACANPPVLMGIGAAGSPVSKNGRLQRRIDCEGSDRVRDTYRVTAPQGAFRTTLESSEFDPFVAVTSDALRTGWGRSSTSGAVTAEHLYAPGRSYELRAVTRDLVSTGGRLEGRYTLSAEAVSLPQEGCIPFTFVDFGSQASGRVTADDCVDAFAPDTATVTRYVDTYVILVPPGQTVTVTLTADFTFNFTRWITAFVEGRFGVQPGQTATMTVTQSPDAPAFHSFSVISGEHQGTGNYTMTFSGGASGSPVRVSGGAQAEAPMVIAPRD